LVPAERCAAARTLLDLNSLKVCARSTARPWQRQSR
jgi:hypothetical protein